VNHGVLWWASGWESWCVMLSHWLWIMVCYSEPVFVNHSELWWSSGCQSRCAMLSQWLRIMVCYAEPVVVNHGGLFRTSGCESWWIMLWKVVVNHDALPVCWAQWLGIMTCPVKVSGCELGCIMPRKVVVNHDVIPYAEPSGWESWCFMPNQWLWIMFCYAEPVFVNHCYLCWANGCES
jgi:hypothetical protein